jgi:predicted nucleotidyltransferase
MSLTETVKQMRKQIINITAAHGAYNVRIFGSVARGEADEKSDIDFLVSISPEFSLMDHVRLEQALEQLLGRRVDVVSDGGLKRPRFRQRVLSEAIPL